MAKVDEGLLDGILVIDAGTFVAGTAIRDNVTEGAACLWSLITSLYLATTSAILTNADPMNYFSYSFSESRGKE